MLPAANTEGKKCAKCSKIGEEMWVCTVSFFLKKFANYPLTLFLIILITFVIKSFYFNRDVALPATALIAASKRTGKDTAWHVRN